MGPVDFATFVDKLATVAGEAIRPFFRTTLGVQNKSSGGVFDPVTEADRAAETAMRALIRKTFPAHGIIGEEFGDEGDAERVPRQQRDRGYLAGSDPDVVLALADAHGALIDGAAHEMSPRRWGSGESDVIPRTS